MGWYSKVSDGYQIPPPQCELWSIALTNVAITQFPIGCFFAHRQLRMETYLTYSQWLSELCYLSILPSFNLCPVPSWWSDLWHRHFRQVWISIIWRLGDFQLRRPLRVCAWTRLDSEQLGHVDVECLSLSTVLLRSGTWRSVQMWPTSLATLDRSSAFPSQRMGKCHCQETYFKQLVWVVIVMREAKEKQRRECNVHYIWLPLFGIWSHVYQQTWLCCAPQACLVSELVLRYCSKLPYNVQSTSKMMPDLHDQEHI